MYSKRPINTHNTYHAHIYFNSSTKNQARKLCEKLAETFDLRMGRFHEKLVGPHPCWSCQFVFTKKHFDLLIAWLDDNKQNLTILIHALSGDDVKDHTDYAYFLGKAEKLNLDIFDSIC